jgi:hypothetical protein
MKLALHKFVAALALLATLCAVPAEASRLRLRFAGRGTGLPGGVAPSNVTLPFFSGPLNTNGKPTDATTLVVSLGAWAGTVTGFDYQIETTDATPTVLVARTAATNSVSGTLPSNVGKSYVVKVWAKNGGTTTLATSAPFGPFEAATEVPILGVVLSQTDTSPTGGYWLNYVAPSTDNKVLRASVRYTGDGSTRATTGIYGAFTNPNPGMETQSQGFNGTADTGGTSVIDANSYADVRLKGRDSNNLSVAAHNYRVDLPAVGTYKFYAGMGASGSAISTGIAMYDGPANGTQLFACNRTAATSTAGNVTDANCNNVSLATWQGGANWGMGTARSFTTVNNSYVTIARDTSVSGGSYLNSFLITQTPAALSPNPYSIVGAETQVVVHSFASLNTAVSAAKPGTVVTLDTVDNSTSNTLTLAQPKIVPGISIVLPATQQLRLRASDVPNLNTEIVGGTYTADLLPGAAIDNSPNGYAVSILRSSRFALRGFTFAQSYIAFQADAATDWEATDFNVYFLRTDIFQMRAPQRFRIANGYGRDMVIRGDKLRYFTDGRDPLDGWGDVNASGVVDAAARFVDTDHSDFVQMYPNGTALGCGISTCQNADYVADFEIANNDIEFLGQGIGVLGYPATGGQIWERGRITGNTVKAMDIRALSAWGNDLYIADNAFSPNPRVIGTANGSQNITQVEALRKDSSSRIVTGRNTVSNVVVGGTTVTAQFTTSTGAGFPAISASAWQQNPPAGDSGLVAPSLPSLPRLPWAPAYSRPAYVPYTGPPVFIVAPAMYWSTGAYPAINDGTPTTGTWLSVGRGKLKGYEGSTLQFRVKIAGTVVATGVRKWQVQAADLGKVHLFEVFASNAYGDTGGWVATNSVTPQ